HHHELQRSRSRGLELRRSADRPQLRRRPVSAEPQLLAVDHGRAVRRMTMRITRTTGIFVLAAALAAVPGCDLDVPDLNNPGIGDLTENPTAAAVSSAATGLVIGNRRNRASANG